MENNIKDDKSYAGIVIDPFYDWYFCLTRSMCRYIESERSDDDWRKAVKEISKEQASAISAILTGNSKKPVKSKGKSFKTEIDHTNGEKVIVEENAVSLLTGSKSEKNYPRLLKYLPLEKTLVNKSEKFFSFFHELLDSLDKELLLFPAILDFPDEATKASFFNNGYGMNIRKGQEVGYSNLYVDYGAGDKKQVYIVLFSSAARALKYGGANYLGALTTVQQTAENYLDKADEINGIIINPDEDGIGLCLPRYLIDYLSYGFRKKRVGES